MTKIFYTETGYDRTIVKFFEVSKETECFYTLMPIGKFNNDFGVNPNRTKIEGDAFKVKKTNKSFMTFNGQSLKENNNYTYK